MNNWNFRKNMHIYEITLPSPKNKAAIEPSYPASPVSEIPPNPELPYRIAGWPGIARLSSGEISAGGLKIDLILHPTNQAVKLRCDTTKGFEVAEIDDFRLGRQARITQFEQYLKLSRCLSWLGKRAGSPPYEQALTVTKFSRCRGRSICW